MDEGGSGGGYSGSGRGGEHSGGAAFQDRFGLLASDSTEKGGTNWLTVEGGGGGRGRGGGGGRANSGDDSPHTARPNAPTADDLDGADLMGDGWTVVNQ